MEYDFALNIKIMVFACSYS